MTSIILYRDNYNSDHELVNDYLNIVTPLNTNKINFTVEFAKDRVTICLEENNEFDPFDNAETESDCGLPF